MCTTMVSTSWGLMTAKKEKGLKLIFKQWKDGKGKVGGDARKSRWNETNTCHDGSVVCTLEHINIPLRSVVWYTLWLYNRRYVRSLIQYAVDHHGPLTPCTTPTQSKTMQLASVLLLCLTNMLVEFFMPFHRKKKQKQNSEPIPSAWTQNICLPF